MSNLDKFQEQRDSRLEQLFGDLPLESDVIVNLPSEGRFYTPQTPTLTITPIKFEDEKQIASNIKNRANPINIMLSKCIKNFDINNLLLIDKLYLLLKIREISYGEKYPAKISCPKCTAEAEVNIYLDKLIVNPIPPDITDPREIELPKLNKKVKVRFPKISDEHFLATQEQIYSNIWRFITELDGITDPIFISKAIPRMHIRDIKYIMANVLRSDLGLDPKFIFDCGMCATETLMSIPINENFFLAT